MAKKMVSFRLSEQVITMLIYLSNKYECSRSDILNGLIRMAYWQCSYDKHLKNVNFDEILNFVK